MIAKISSSQRKENKIQYLEGWGDWAWGSIALPFLKHKQRIHKLGSTRLDLQPTNAQVSNSYIFKQFIILEENYEVVIERERGA
jgi:hypothetical protein